MIKNWDTDRVINDCEKMWRGANDPYVTGWNNWPCKQDLYRVKFAVDEMLKHTSTFAGEEEWLAEMEKQQVWKILTKK
jgi:hypothetical protein